MVAESKPEVVLIWDYAKRCYYLDKNGFRYFMCHNQTAGKVMDSQLMANVACAIQFELMWVEKLP